MMMMQKSRCDPSMDTLLLTTPRFSPPRPIIMLAFDETPAGGEVLLPAVSGRDSTSVRAAKTAFEKSCRECRSKSGDKARPSTKCR